MDAEFAFYESSETNLKPLGQVYKGCRMSFTFLLSVCKGLQDAHSSVDKLEAEPQKVEREHLGLVFLSRTPLIHDQAIILNLTHAEGVCVWGGNKFEAINFLRVTIFRYSPWSEFHTLKTHGRNRCTRVLFNLKKFSSWPTSQECLEDTDIIFSGAVH